MIDIEVEEIINKEVFLRIGARGYVLRPGDTLRIQPTEEEGEEEEEEEVNALVDSLINALRLFK